MTIMAAPGQYEVMLNNYASIVEKTNEQLGFWVNTSSLAVAILSALIAIVAIIVAVTLWKISKEQRDQIEKFFSEQEVIIREKNKNIEKIESRFDDLINKYEDKLKAFGAADTESKKQIQQAIDELRKEKISAGAYLAPASGLQHHTLASFNSADTVGTSFFIGRKSMICSNCGKSFEYPDDYHRFLSMNAAAVGGAEIVHCSHCGALNVKQ